jgi:glycosyltransferase involved in cell wall biosynthesis
MTFSIVIPARNEAQRIGACLESIRAASEPYPGQVEVVVVLNRCTDATEEIALRHGARMVRDDRRNLAMIRNTGARAATGGMLVTIDADSRMSPNMLAEIDRTLGGGKTVGGGVPIRPERWSVGIILTGLLIQAMLPGLSAGLFWCLRKDFEALGGFNESLRVGEDVDFAKRLRALGRRVRKPFRTLWRTHIVTSCRKFDVLGDWYCLRRPRMLWRAVHGREEEGVGDRLFYDFKR